MRKRFWIIIPIPFVVLLLGTVLLVVVGAAPAEPGRPQTTTWYVDDDTCPAAGSGSLLDPYCRIQAAVDAASAGDEIRVATGRYTGSQTVAYDWGQIGGPYTYTQVVLITKPLTLCGGFDPGDWETSSPADNPTVIDAEGYGRGISVVHVRSNLVTVDGFTITGGDYTGLGNPADAPNQVCEGPGGTPCGGGVYAYFSSLVIRNSVITGNVAGEGVRAPGGGIFLRETLGGTRIENTVVAANKSLGAYGAGGGLYVAYVHAPLTIARCTFRDNVAETDGGGLFLEDVNALVTIQETDIVSNTARAEGGGGAYIQPTGQGDNLRMDRVRFLGNRAQSRAAALHLRSAFMTVQRAELTNLVFARNVTTATYDWDAVVGIEAGSGGLEVSLAHVTAADNQAPTFLYAEIGGNPGQFLTVGLTNTLVASFTHAFAVNESGEGEAFLRHANTLASDVTSLNSVLGGAPTLESVDPVLGDPKLDQAYRLQAGSAAIDAGLDAGVPTDVDGDFRPQAFAPDIGADEYVFDQAPTSVAITGPTTVPAMGSATFGAQISPVTATLPVTYLWETTDRAPVTHPNLGLTGTVTFVWPTAGAKRITVTATSARGAATAAIVVDVVGEPILSIHKEGPAEAGEGEPITYTLTVTNSGIIEAHGLVITDRVPSGASYVTGGSVVDSEVQWSLASLEANGGVVELPFVVTATQTITNSDYGVSASGGYYAGGTTPVVTVVGGPALTITKTGPYGVAVGEPINYELTVTNNGSVAAEHLIITDVLPAGTVYVSGGTLAGGEVSWEVESVPANGGQAVVSFVVTSDDSVVNEDYGVTADGGFRAVAASPMATIVGTGTRYVAPGGDDGMNACTDSSQPCATLQHAVYVASAGEEVRAATGVYTGAQTIAYDWGQVGGPYTYTQVVLITKPLTLCGGFDPGDWETSSPVDYPTVIDAEGYGRGISVVHVRSNLVTVDGFMVTGGDYTGLGNPADAPNQVCEGPGGTPCGGGVYAYFSSLVIRNSVITGNVAGEGLRSPGGGIFLRETLGGTRIEDTVVAANKSLGAYGVGGGLYIDYVHAPLTITRCSFRDNVAETDGGGLFLEHVNALVTIQETDIVSNTAHAEDGGGAYIQPMGQGDNLRMDRVRFLGNRAQSRAAALHLRSAWQSVQRAELTNLVFDNNVTTATYDFDAVVGIEAGSDGLEVSLAHVTAANNQAPTFLYAEIGGDPGEFLTISLTNTLVVSFTNAFAVKESGGGEAFLRHVNTLVDDVTTTEDAQGGSPTFEGLNTLTGGSGLGQDYHIEFDSAALDAGVDAGVAVDIDGQPRPYGDHPDIGADELVPMPPESVAISGPGEGTVGRSYTFRGTVAPPTATGPFTFTWAPGPLDGQGEPTAMYAWPTEGIYTITVTAANGLGTTPAATHAITVQSYTIYLPLVVRSQ